MGLAASCTYHTGPAGGSGASVTTRLRAMARADAVSACACPSRSRVSIWRTYSQPATGKASVQRATSRSLRRRVMGRRYRKRGSMLRLGGSRLRSRLLQVQGLFGHLAKQREQVPLLRVVMRQCHGPAQADTGDEPGIAKHDDIVLVVRAFVQHATAGHGL